MEFWRDAEIYDVHYLNRIKDCMLGGAAPATPSRPASRRYGRAGFEWYQHNFFTEIDGVWQPEKPSERSVIVRW